MKKVLLSVLVAFAMAATVFIQQAGAAGSGIVASATGSGPLLSVVNAGHSASRRTRRATGL